MYVRTIAVLEELSPAKAVKRGETMAEFFRTSRHQHTPPLGERVTDFITRFGEAVQRLSDDRASFGQETRVLGWFLVQRLNLTAGSRECVVAALPDED